MGVKDAWKNKHIWTSLSSKFAVLEFVYKYYHLWNISEKTELQFWITQSSGGIKAQIMSIVLVNSLLIENNTNLSKNSMLTTETAGATWFKHSSMTFFSSPLPLCEDFLLLALQPYSVFHVGAVMLNRRARLLWAFHRDLRISLTYSSKSICYAPRILSWSEAHSWISESRSIRPAYLQTHDSLITNQNIACWAQVQWRSNYDYFKQTLVALGIVLFSWLFLPKHHSPSPGIQAPCTVGNTLLY